MEAYREFFLVKLTTLQHISTQSTFMISEVKIQLWSKFKNYENHIVWWMMSRVIS
jgi:hypothetical protein